MFSLTANAKQYEWGISELLKDFGKGLARDGVVIDFVKDEGDKVSLNFDGKNAVITGSKPVHFYRGFASLLDAIRKGNTSVTINEKSHFELFGNMIDCSRNSVLTVESVKKYIRFLAACGMNMMMLYTEDTYEVKDYPYFGAYRGRYTHEELRQIDDYANKFGIEVIPCIQTLAHLKTALRWPAFDSISDTDDILLVGDENTYKFIESEVRAVTSAIRSKKVHIGMDEAWRLGLGTYLRKNGYRQSADIMLEHVTKVQEICDRIGVETIMWSDMFFRVLSPSGGYYDVPDEVTAFPFDFSKNCHLTYWDYYHKDFAMYERYLKLHLTADEDAYFAGGGWTWNGMCPNYDKAFSCTDPAIKACKAVGMKNVFCTMWQDNGAETSQRAGLPSVLFFAELGYKDAVDMKTLSDKLLLLTGLPFESYKLMGDMDAQAKRTDENLSVTPSKYALYQDPMLGLYDSHIKDMGMKRHYTELVSKFDSLEVKNDLTDYYREFASALSIKAELGLDMIDAYKAGDKERLKEIANTIIPECITRVEKTHALREKIWMNESKPNGFEIIDIRFSGVEGRLRAAKRRIEAYLDGSVDSLPELEEERLLVNPDFEGKLLSVNQWDKIASACSFVGV